MAEKKNLLPAVKNWSKGGNTASTITYATGDNYSCSWTASSESDYIYYKMTAGVAGKKLFLCCTEFNSSDGEGWINVRAYKADDTYTSIVDIQNASGPQEIEMDIGADITVLRIYFRHYWASQGINPAATMTLTGVMLYEDVQPESLTALNFHKVLRENLPAKVDAGTQHIYYVTDGTTVQEYIANREGYLVPVGAGGSAGTSTETAYTNVYTQQHIDERKDEIMKLVNDGHCIVWATATDIHVRIEDGDAGRYNQVRDFIMVTNQLPIDYILCEGDLMSYCQDWGNVYEPRCDKVRKIFDQCRCPWYVTRGNHDYNTDSNNPGNSNPNIKDYTSDVNKYFITDRAWTRTIAAKMPFTMQHRVHFDEAHPQNGYFYVDDFEHKHRIVMCNSEETMETDTGHAWVGTDGQIDAFISGVQSLAQVEWLITKAMNFADKPDRADWVVSFHSHTVPYSDMNEEDKSEFHGYGWDNPEIRGLVTAFMNGNDLDFKYSVIDVDKHQWMEYQKNCAFSKQGPMKVLGWFGGHCHDDCYRKVNGLNVDISTCTCASQRKNWGKDPTPKKMAPERNSTDLAMSVNIFIVNLDKRKINMIKLGSKRDNAVKASSDLEFTY